MSTLNLLLSAGGFLANYGDELKLSGEMMLRGMGTVFMVLVILWIILSVFGSVFSKGSKADKKPAPKTEKPVQTKQDEAPAAPVTATAVQDDSALIAAITAAITAYNAAEGKPNLPFRVVSYKRKNNAAGWMGNSAENQ